MAQAIGCFVSLHPYNLAQKTEIIIEHSHPVVARMIGGRAKAMLVTSSRLHAKRYFEEFKKNLRTWANSYSFLVQIMPFREAEFEKFYAYAKLLQTKLPKRDLSESMKLVCFLNFPVRKYISKI